MINLSTLQVLQLLTFAFSLVGIACAFRFAMSNSELWVYMLPPVGWLLHLEIFYTAVFLRDYVGLDFYINFTLWSVWLRLQAVFITTGILMMFAYGHVVIKERIAGWRPTDVN